MASSVQRSFVDGETVTNIKHETGLILNDAVREVPKTMALTNNSATNQSFGKHSEVSDCVVCGDRATGKHYGAISCDGCKGFFRRSVRKNSTYECQRQKNCTIDKDKRNQCRHCRWKKCIRMGMRKEAVQKERDRLRRQSNPSVDDLALKKDHHILTADDEQDDLSVMTLYQAEQTAKEYIGRQIRMEHHPSDTQRVQATLETIGISMNYQLRSLIEWAKDLTSFVELSDHDKIALLRGHTGENLVLGLACRSLNCDDYLLLGNHYIIRRTTSDAGLTKAAGRILDEIVKPLKEIQLDEKEYACLKAIVFFDNDNKSLSDPMRVKAIRKRIQVNLENYIHQQKPLMRGRFGELLLLMPPLQNIARLMVDLVARYNQDTKQVDDLINEMLLNRYRDDCQDSMISTTTHTINLMPTTTSSSSPSTSISKENDFDSNTSSLDTDTEDNSSHGMENGTSIPNASHSGLIVPPVISDDLCDVSITLRDEYGTSDLSPIHLLHSNSIHDPNLNHHNAPLINNANNTDLAGYQYDRLAPYYDDPSSSDSAQPAKRQKLIANQSRIGPIGATRSNYYPIGQMNSTYDLVNPSSITNRPSVPTTNNGNSYFETDWNRRTSLPVLSNNFSIPQALQEYQPGKIHR